MTSGLEALMPRRPSTHIDDTIEFDKRLEQARLAAGLTQRDLAFPGCTAAYISVLEAGRRTASLQVVRELARRIGVSEEYLLSGQSDRPQEPIEITYARIENLVRMYPAEEHGKVLAVIDGLINELTERREEDLASSMLRQNAELSLVAAGLTEQRARKVVADALSK